VLKNVRHHPTKGAQRETLGTPQKGGLKVNPPKNSPKVFSVKPPQMGRPIKRLNQPKESSPKNLSRP